MFGLAALLRVHSSSMVICGIDVLGHPVGLIRALRTPADM
jgi:hypothetical protein